MTQNKVYSVLSEQFIIRMRNWARSNAGIGIESVISGIYQDIGGGSDGYTSRAPITLGEAEDTSKALGKLPIRYRQAVELFWQYEGRSLEWFGNRTGTSRHTYTDNVMYGHQLLVSEIDKMHDEVTRYRNALKAFAE